MDRLENGLGFDKYPALLTLAEDRDLSKSGKNLCCSIIRKSASTGAQEAKDKRAPQLADLMTHSLDTAKKHYYVRLKQLSAASGSSALMEVVFKHGFSTLAQLEEAPSVSVFPGKYWK